MADKREDTGGPEDTELVDVSEVSESLPAEDASKKRGEPDTEDELVYLESRSTIATIRERFAAFLIDMIFLFYAYYAIGVICRRAFYGSWSGPIPSYGWQGAAFHSLFFFFVFMYYLICEGVFFATIGKFCCWMYVRKKNGDFPALSSVFIRNVFRLFDYLLPFIPFFMMELTRRHQRLGDMIAGTTVIKKHRTREYIYNVTMANIASASGRVLSSLIDIVIAGTLTFGYILILSPEYPEISKWMLIFTPLVPLLYFLFSETLTHTSPGKWIFGYTICHEDGAPVSLSGSIVRTLVRIFDMNPVGLATVWISPKRQRFGDLAADTLITKQPRRWQGLLGLVVLSIISGLVFWAGWNNNASIIRPEFKFNFAPTLEIMGGFAEESAYKQLTVTHVRFAAGDVNTIRTPPVFQPGETVYIISDVYGYERSGRMVWIQEDLDVRYPDASIGLHQENIVDYHQVLQTRGAVELTNSLKLPPDAKDGTYIVTITVRDLFGHQSATIKQTFDVRGPQPETAPVPETVQQQPGTAPQQTPQMTPPQNPGPSLNAPPPGTNIPPPTGSPPPASPPAATSPNF